MDIIEGQITDSSDGQEMALTVYADTQVQVSGYGDDMAAMGELARQAYQHSGFSDQLKERSANTLRRKRNDLYNFCRYLEQAGITRTADELLNDPQAWTGINLYIVAGFKQWLLEQGMYYTTVNCHLATIRHFCKMAGPQASGGAGVLDADTVMSIATVKDITAKTAYNIDQDRNARGIATRVGRKKADPTPISLEQTKQLKQASITPDKARSRPHDLSLETRDRLMLCLMLEHALRCSEVRDLNIEHLNLQTGAMTFFRKKTRITETHILKRQTLSAAQNYLLQIKKIDGRTAGPLFTGYQGKRISTAAINHRVGLLGATVDLDTLSPHDLRHEWTIDALRSGTPIDRVQAGGGWASQEMVLRYAKRTGIANAGVKLSSDFDD